MSQYKPDAWVVVELGAKETRHYRVLASWYGGFAGPSRWKLSSGILKIEKDGEVYKIHNHSGSVYHCHQDCERLSSLAQNIFHSLGLDPDLDPKVVAIKDVKISTCSINPFSI